MRFEKYCFGLGVPVVPVAMKVINPWPLEVCITRRVHRLSTCCGDTSTRGSIGSCQPDALPVAQRAKPIGVCSH